MTDKLERPYAKQYKKRYPLESFDPRYKELLLKGATERVSLTFPTTAKAMEFQRRAYIYRTRAKEADMKDWHLLFRCKLSRWDATLTLSPYDSEFGDVFSQAGLVEDMPEFSILTPTEQSAPETATVNTDPLVDPAFPSIPKEYLP